MLIILSLCSQLLYEQDQSTLYFNFLLHFAFNLPPLCLLKHKLVAHEGNNSIHQHDLTKYDETKIEDLDAAAIFWIPLETLTEASSGAAKVPHRAAQSYKR